MIKCDLWFKLLLASAKLPGLVAPGMVRQLRSEIDARFGIDLLGESAKKLRSRPLSAPRPGS